MTTPLDRRAQRALLGIAIACTALVACGAPATLPDRGDRAGLLAALGLLPDDPEGAMAHCASLGNATRGDCVVAAVEAAPDHADAASWCGLISPGIDHDECYFQLAEGRNDLAACALAGSFVDDCRLHLWSGSLRKTVRAGEPMPPAIAAAQAQMTHVGIDSNDLRYWSAFFRIALAGRPLDRRPCTALTDAHLRDACWNTGAALFHDRLNRARDTNRLDCTAGPPDSLRAVDDAELDRVLNQRWADDLCDPAARRAPPPDRH